MVVSDDDVHDEGSCGGETGCGRWLVTVWVVVLLIVDDVGYRW